MRSLSIRLSSYVAAPALIAAVAACGGRVGPPEVSGVYFVEDDLQALRMPEAGIRMGVEGSGMDPTAMAVQLGAAMSIGLPTGGTEQPTVTVIPDLNGDETLFRINWAQEEQLGWHLVSIDLRSMQMRVEGNVVELPYDQIGVRTATGDNPVVARIEFPMSGSAVDSMLLVFSQPVRLDDGMAVQDAVQLSDESGNRLAVNDVAGVLSSGDAFRYWQLDASAFPDALELSLAHIVTESGAPLVNVDGTPPNAPLRLSLTSLPVRDGSRVWSAPLL